MLLPTVAYDWIPLHHLKENGDLMLISAAVWQAVFALSDRLSNSFGSYRRLSPSKKLDWRMHVVSMVHALLMVALCIPILNSKELQLDPVFGTTRYAERVYSIAGGYFLWDIYVSARYFSLTGIQFLFHGSVAFTVVLCLFRPIFQYFGAIFLMFECSTIFLNIHWFCDKTGNSGGTFQLVNGICLLLSFFSVRLCFGTYQIYRLISSAVSNLYQYPMTLFWIYTLACITMQSLNFFWFYAMIKSVASRFRPKDKVL
jgi:ABC-type transport system involved in multi-copper enzyme maturation permease subunit